MADEVARAITEALNSVNEADTNGEIANVVDGLFAIARAISRLAKANEGLNQTAGELLTAYKRGTKS